MTRKDYEEFKEEAKKRLFKKEAWEKTAEKRAFRDGYNSAVLDLIKVTETLVDVENDNGK